MRYVHVSPKGQVTPVEGEGGDIVDAGLHKSLDAAGVTVWFDENSSGAFNWQAQRLLRDRLMPEDRVCGDVIVTGQGGVSLDEGIIQSLVERFEQHAG